MEGRHRVSRHHSERHIRRRRRMAGVEAITHIISYHCHLSSKIDRCMPSVHSGSPKPRRKTYCSDHGQVVFNAPCSRRCSGQASSNPDSERHDDGTDNTQANGNNLNGPTEASWVDRFELVGQSLYLLTGHRGCHSDDGSAGVRPRRCLSLERPKDNSEDVDVRIGC